MKSNVKLTGNMQFTASADSGHEIVMDAPTSVGGENSGPKPSELILMGLGGCTGMDVISILRKKKQEITGFEMNVTADIPENRPRTFTDFHIEYIFRGRDISEEAVKRAIDLSKDKYCLVGMTLAKASKMTYSFKVIQE